jgi:hypothetical protein
MFWTCLSHVLSALHGPPIGPSGIISIVEGHYQQRGYPFFRLGLIEVARLGGQLVHRLPRYATRCGSSKNHWMRPQLVQTRAEPVISVQSRLNNVLTGLFSMASCRMNVSLLQCRQTTSLPAAWYRLASTRLLRFPIVFISHSTHDAGAQDRVPQAGHWHASTYHSPNSGHIKQVIDPAQSTGFHSVLPILPTLCPELQRCLASLPPKSRVDIAARTSKETALSNRGILHPPHPGGGSASQAPLNELSRVMVRSS